MLNKILLSTLFLASTSAIASVPPTNCVFGDTGTANGPFYKLSLKSPEYAIVNASTTFKISGPELAGNSELRTVDFETQYEGVQTPFKLDYWDGEDYKTHVFKRTGENWVWAWKEGSCSKDLVNVHYRPTLTVDSNITKNNYTSSATLYLDSQYFPFSKADIEGLNMKYEIQRKVISKISNDRNYCEVIDDTTNWEIARFNSSETYQVEENCEVLFKIRAFDGAHYSFSKTVRLLALPESNGGGTGGGSGGGSGSGNCTGRICSEEP